MSGESKGEGRSLHLSANWIKPKKKKEKKEKEKEKVVPTTALNHRPLDLDQRARKKRGK